LAAALRVDRVSDVVETELMEDTFAQQVGETYAFLDGS